MKKKSLVFILFISIFFCFSNVSAEVIEKDRNAEKNLGVNKHWTINDDNRDNVMNTPYVDASEKIYDFSDILTDEEENNLKKLIDNYITHTNMDMVIVTVDLPYSYDAKNEEYAADFYDYNDFGLDFDKYSGVLLLRNTYEPNKYFNVYMFGNAQLYYNFDRSEDMLDNIYFDLSHDFYYDGFSTFISNYLAFYNQGIPSDMKDYYVNEDGYLTEMFNPPIFWIFVGSAVISILSICVMVSKNKMIKVATKARDYLNKDTVEFTDSRDEFINSRTTSYVMSSSSGGSSGGGGGGHHSSGGSSGGGHSSGGGRHG